MIMAEVKTEDGGEWETRLYNCSWAQFRSMADRRFVAIGKTLEIPLGSVIDCLKRHAGWNELPSGGFIRGKHY